LLSSTWAAPHHSGSLWNDVLLLCAPAPGTRSNNPYGSSGQLWNQLYFVVVSAFTVISVPLHIHLHSRRLQTKWQPSALSVMYTYAADVRYILPPKLTYSACEVRGWLWRIIGNVTQVFWNLFSPCLSNWRPNTECSLKYLMASPTVEQVLNRKFVYSIKRHF